MAKKVQSQILVSLPTRRRADVLALIRGESRAEVFRLALEGKGLTDMEQKSAEDLKALIVVAARLEMTAGELAEKAMADRLSFQEVLSLKAYPAYPEQSRA